MKMRAVIKRRPQPPVVPQMPPPIQRTCPFRVSTRERLLKWFNEAAHGAPADVKYPVLCLEPLKDASVPPPASSQVLPFLCSLCPRMSITLTFEIVCL